MKEKLNNLMQNKPLLLTLLGVLVISLFLNVTLFFRGRYLQAYVESSLIRPYYPDQRELLFDLVLNKPSEEHFMLLYNELSSSIWGMSSRVLSSIELDLAYSDKRFDPNISINYGNIGGTTAGSNKYSEFFRFLGQANYITKAELHKIHAIRAVWAASDADARSKKLTQDEYISHTSYHSYAYEHRSIQLRGFSLTKTRNTDTKVLAEHYVTLIDNLFNTDYTFTDFVSPRTLDCMQYDIHSFLDSITITKERSDFIVNDSEEINKLFTEMRELSYQRNLDFDRSDRPLYRLRFTGKRERPISILIDIYEDMVKIGSSKAGIPLDPETVYIHHYQDFKGFYNVEQEQMQKLIAYLQSITASIN